MNATVAGIDHSEVPCFPLICGTNFKMVHPILYFLLGSINILAFANGLINTTFFFLKRVVIG